jgi:hypothetical protein
MTVKLLMVVQLVHHNLLTLRQSVCNRAIFDMDESKSGWKNVKPARERQVLQDRLIDLEPLKKLLKETFPACAEEDFKVEVRTIRDDMEVSARSKCRQW